MNMGQYSISTIIKKIKSMALSSEYSDYIHAKIKDEELKAKIAKFLLREKQFLFLAIVVKLYSSFKK